MLYTYPVFAKNHLPHRGNLSLPSPGLINHLGHIALNVKFNILCTDFQFHGAELSQLRHWLLQGWELGNRVVQCQPGVGKQGEGRRARAETGSWFCRGRSGSGGQALVGVIEPGLWKEAVLGISALFPLSMH